MKLTKYQHSCLVLESGGAQLVIDPGGFTELPPLTQVAAVVVTHEHLDHAHTDHLHALQRDNPEAPILGPDGVDRALPQVQVQVVEPGEHRQHGPFDLRFGGGLHAAIHPSIPRVENLTVQVGETLYHPGDSLEPPSEAVSVLAAPISGPWLKLGEVMDYVLASRSGTVLPIHEMLASERGRGIAYDRLDAIAADQGGELVVLAPGQTLTI